MLRIAALEMSIAFDADGAMLPWLGTALRGGLGAALKSLSCTLKDAACGSCPLARTCAYGYLFDTPVPAGTPDAKIPNAPHPFVLKPPLIEAVEAGAQVDFGLVLVGRAIEYLPYFVLALEELGRRGLGRDRAPFRLVSVKCAETGEQLELDRISAKDTCFVLNPLEERGSPPEENARFRIVLKTPVRLKSKNQQSFRFDFGTFLLGIVRRIELLGTWHCGVDLFKRFSHLVESGKEVALVEDRTYFHDWMRFSKRQGALMPVGGIMGEAVLCGDYGSYSGLFRAAGYVGVGKQTSFGLGQVEFDKLI